MPGDPVAAAVLAACCPELVGHPKQGHSEKK